MSNHEFEDLSQYCVKCGCSYLDYISDHRPECDPVGNVTGISHVIQRKKLQKFIESSLITSSMVA